MSLKSPYHDWIKSLVDAGYGNLRVLEESLMQNSKHVDATCTVLTLTKDGALEARRAATDEDFILPSECKSNRAFVIEGLSRDMVEKVGSAFEIEPEFFGSHLRATTWNYYDGRSNAIPLPSIRKQSNFWTLEYWECVQLTGRHHLGVILVDSPLPKLIRFAYDNFEDSQECPWVPYQGGPLDFANLETRKDFLQRHPKSVKESLISRLNFPKRALPAPIGASTTAAILQQIVLSNWALTLRFLRRDFDSVNLSDLANDSVDTSQTESTLQNLGSCRNLLERCSVITRRNLAHLKIAPKENISRSIQDANTTCDLLHLDWLFTSDEIQHCINETDQFINIRLASFSVLDSKRTAMLSYSSNQISKLGQLLILFFTPAAFAYGVLSMGGDFLPGNKKFWIFWAVAIPLSTITNMIFYLWRNHTYRSHGMGVS
ncbi:uncharacterized protein N0V89_006318 [Didymosphaeria variabile]|uniref:Cora-domain-containing protein n=1 Tax=Didymosphaeria variabile TaxID=1932322 RepID=A0A9W8XN04_9PLEO|nr:uncharacterized protein N0V89_006318 [Didymosphaeria variabile]KAJ4354581.1 hypothetical protein N0V89_006318 [Didymosphaeria variabile]